MRDKYYIRRYRKKVSITRKTQSMFHNSVNLRLSTTLSNYIFFNSVREDFNHLNLWSINVKIAYIYIYIYGEISLILNIHPKLGFTLRVIFKYIPVLINCYLQSVNWQNHKSKILQIVFLSQLHSVFMPT